MLFESERKQAGLLLVIVMAMFIDGFNNIIVSLTLPELTVFFDISVSDATWVYTIYFLSLACPLLILSRVCDHGSIKRMLMCGNVVIIIGSILCSASISYPMFLVARAIEGIGVSMVVSSAFMMPIKFLPKEKYVLGFLSVSIGMALGSLTGSILNVFATDHTTWEDLFLLKVPMEIITFAFAWKMLPKDLPHSREKFDYIGSTYLFLMIFAGLYFVNTCTLPDQSVYNVLTLLAFVIFVILFIHHCSNRENPIIDIGIFSGWKMNACIIVVVIANICYVGTLYLLPFYITKVLGYSHIENGMLTYMMASINIVVAFIVSRLITRFKVKYFAMIGCLMLVLASISLFFVESSPFLLMLLAAIGLGLLWAFGGGAFPARIIRHASESSRGYGASINTFSTYIGSAVATVVYSLFFHMGSRSGAEPIDTLSSSVFLNGFHVAMLAGLALSVIALLLTLSVKDDEPDQEPV